MTTLDASRRLLLSSLARYFRLELAGRTEAIPNWGRGSAGPALGPVPGLTELARVTDNAGIGYPQRV